MVVEEIDSSSAGTAIPNANVDKHGPQREGEDDTNDHPEEAEGVDPVGDEVSKAMAEDATHPLEHSWTFWFDNPSGKAKQVAWGRSIRSVYTFSTVEQFWGYSISPSLYHPFSLFGSQETEKKCWEMGLLFSAFRRVCRFWCFPFIKLEFLY